MFTLLKKIRNLFLHPTDFFSSVEKERNFRNLFIYLKVILILGVIITAVVENVSTSQSSSGHTYLLALLYLLITKNSLLIGNEVIMATVFLYVLYFIGIFFQTTFIHFFARLLKGKGSFLQTYKAIGYSSTPQLLFASLPFFGTIAGFWMALLQLKGLQKLHKVSMRRAFVILTLGFFSFFVLIVLPIIFIIISGMIK